MRLIDADEQIRILESIKKKAESNGNEVVFSINNVIKFFNGSTTAYDIDKVVEELEKELNLADKEKERCTGENHLQFDSVKGYASGISSAIEIVKQGGVDVANDATTKNDDVCEWKAIGANDNWSTGCDKNSTHNVFGVAWFNRCPYCGRKIKLVE